MKIDWNEAPEWAVAHALYTFVNQITPVWVGVDQWQDVIRGKPFPYGGGTGEARHNPTRKQFQYETPRPAPWAGEGLPPVGTVCELWYSSGEWAPCTVMAHDVSMAIPIAVVRHGEQCYTGSSRKTLRPIRTPEQIAAEERSRDIGQALSAIGAERLRIVYPNATDCTAITKAVVEALYDAGYLKQVKP